MDLSMPEVAVVSDGHLVDDITHAEVKEEKIIDCRYYHTIKEVKNGEGPHPIKTPKGWLHLAHGVRGCAAGLRYVLYMYMTSLEDPSKLIAAPGGYFMAPEGEERIGDVSNVLFTNGWIADEDGKVFIYYASSDTRMHVAVSTIDKLVDYCMNTPQDGLTTTASVETLKKLIDKNLKLIKIIKNKKVSTAMIKLTEKNRLWFRRYGFLYVLEVVRGLFDDILYGCIWLACCYGGNNVLGYSYMGFCIRSDCWSCSRPYFQPMG